MATLRIPHAWNGGEGLPHLQETHFASEKGEGVTSFCLIPCWPTPTRTSISMAATSTFRSRTKTLTCTSTDDGEASTAWPRRIESGWASVELEFSLYDEPVTDDVAAKTMAELKLV